MGVEKNGYFGIPDKQGRYEIKDAPPGVYDFKMWYKRKVSPSYTVTVEKGKDAIVDFK